MKDDNVVKEKSMAFAVRIAKMSRFLLGSMSVAEQPLCSQILKSGTSIGANIREAEHAESKIDFIHKLKVALKEANETEYWLVLLYKSGYIDERQYESLNNDCQEINKLLIAIIVKLKTNESQSQ